MVCKANKSTHRLPSMPRCCHPASISPSETPVCCSADGRRCSPGWLCGCAFDCAKPKLISIVIQGNVTAAHNLFLPTLKPPEIRNKKAQTHHLVLWSAGTLNSRTRRTPFQNIHMLVQNQISCTSPQVKVQFFRVKYESWDGETKRIWFHRPRPVCLHGSGDEIGSRLNANAAITFPAE